MPKVHPMEFFSLEFRKRTRDEKDARSARKAHPALPFLTDSVVENTAFCAALAGAFVCSQFCHSAPRAEDVRTKAKD
jgi:hypothetical protein